MHRLIILLISILLLILFLMTCQKQTTSNVLLQSNKKAVIDGKISEDEYSITFKTDFPLFICPNTSFFNNDIPFSQHHFQILNLTVEFCSWWKLDNDFDPVSVLALIIQVNLDFPNVQFLQISWREQRRYCCISG